MTEFLAGVRLQFALFRRNPGMLAVFVSLPFFSAIFLSGVEAAKRSSLAADAVLGPSMIGLWAISLDLGGSLVDNERVQQTFELLVIAPSSLPRVIAGRIFSITGLGMLAFVESILFARVAFGVQIHISQPAPMALTLAATAVAMAGTSTAMATVFVAMRAARRFGNVLGYPFYIIGGLLVPVTFLPLWIRPLSWLTYLYWSSDLLRDCLTSRPIADFGWQLLAVLATGLIAYLAGMRVMFRVIEVLRNDGTVGLS
jgi:ABC-2 type transport system permease protein